MARFLVTGGDGFIGSHLAEGLLKEGGQVRVMDNLIARGGANLELLKSLNTGRLEVMVADIRDQEACFGATEGVDFVFHLAALGSVSRSVEDPKTTHEVNATGTLNLLWAAKESRVKRFVWASSSSVYGDPESAETPKKEGMRPQPLSPYGVSKLTGEHYARNFFELYGLPTLSLRYFNVFGPRQDSQGPYAAVIPKFIELMLAGQRPTIYGDGRQSRDFTYVKNIVLGNLAALKTPRPAGQAVNLATGQNYDLLFLVERLNSLLGAELAPIFAPARPGDVRHSLADVTLAEKILAYRIAIDFDQGLALTLKAFGRS